VEAYSTGGTETPTTRRVWRELRPRVTRFVPVAASAADLLAALPVGVERVFMVGGRPGGDARGVVSWAVPEAGLPPGWEAGQHYLDGMAPVMRYRHANGHRVELLRAAGWFGEGDYTAAEAAAAWGRLAVLCRAVFPESQLLTTPATTGRELFLRSIPRKFDGWPTLPLDLQDLIRSTAGQGRIELLGARGQEQLGGLAELDGRLMYAALAWGMPTGEVTHDTRGEDAGLARARYRVEGEVPRDWAERCACGAPGHDGIGLFGVHGDAGGMRYPHEPGEPYACWVDGAELRVALLHGWRPAIRERLVWAGSRGKAPLDVWARQLTMLYQRCAEDRDPAGELARRGARAIVLHAIGAFWGKGTPVTYSVPMAEAHRVPEGVEVRLEGTHLVWVEQRGPSWPALAHPEWCASIWARARARLLDGPGETGGLHTPAQNVVAFRTDAIYAQHAPAWRDDGKAGRLRLKSYRPGPLPWPASHGDLLAMRAG
jgi:hypothetical protein